MEAEARAAHHSFPARCLPPFCGRSSLAILRLSPFSSSIRPPGVPTRLSRDYVHIVADFVGVPANQLADRTLVCGLIVAAAGAAGINAPGVPTMRNRKLGGITAALLDDDCHITVHAIPERELLLLDVLVPKAIDASRAVDVFARRLTARHVHKDTRERA